MVEMTIEMPEGVLAAMRQDPKGFAYDAEGSDWPIPFNSASSSA